MAANINAGPHDCPATKSYGDAHIDWTCVGCLTENWASRSSCRGCGITTARSIAESRALFESSMATTKAIAESIRSMAASFAKPVVTEPLATEPFVEPAHKPVADEPLQLPALVSLSHGDFTTHAQIGYEQITHGGVMKIDIGEPFVEPFFPPVAGRIDDVGTQFYSIAGGPDPFAEPLVEPIAEHGVTMESVTQAIADAAAQVSETIKPIGKPIGEPMYYTIAEESDPPAQLFAHDIEHVYEELEHHHATVKGHSMNHTAWKRVAPSMLGFGTISETIDHDKYAVYKERSAKAAADATQARMKQDGITRALADKAVLTGAFPAFHGRASRARRPRFAHAPRPPHRVR